MTLSELIAALRERRVELRVDDGRLRSRAPEGALTPELAEQIGHHKGALLELLSSVSEFKPQQGSAIKHVEERRQYRLSSSQARAVSAAQVGSALPTAFRFRGPLVVGLLHQTLKCIVARHAPLRIRIVQREELLQEVVERPVLLESTDLSSLEGERKAKQLSEVLEDLRSLPLFIEGLEAQVLVGTDAGSRTPYRFHLIRLSENDHVLFVAFSPLVFDGWSFDVFWNELRLGYAALAEGRQWPAPALEVEYVDYVHWTARRLTESEERLQGFWREFLGKELPPLPLPTDRRRGDGQSSSGGSLPFSLPQDAEQGLRSLAKELKATPQTVMLAVLFVLLHRISGQTRLVVGTPVEARLEPALEQMIGRFVNMLLIPADLNPEELFSDLVGRLQNNCLRAYEHQDLPIEQLRVRSAGRVDGTMAPAFQVELSFQQVHERGSHMGPLSISQEELKSGAATSDLTFWVKDWGDRIAGAVEFRADLFEQTTAQHWTRCYVSLLTDVLKRRACKIGELEVVPDDEEPLLFAQRAAVSQLPQAISALARIDQVERIEIVDSLGLALPLGGVGRVRIHRVGREPVETSVQAHLLHDGRLVQKQAPERRSGQVRRSPVGPPATDLELQLVALFRRHLETNDLSIDDDFFDNGGNSLLAVKLVVEIGELFGQRITTSTLLTAGTPRLLAQELKQKFSNGRCSIQLKVGSSGRSLFLIHDADGETLLYRNLALLLPEWLNVFGIAPQSRGRIPMVHLSIQEAAAHYVREIQKLQPSGPYLLGGLCAGGMIAYEMARQLVALGEEVELLALLDAAPPTARKRENRFEARKRRYLELFASSKWVRLPKSLREAVLRPLNVVRYEAARTQQALSFRMRRMLLEQVNKTGLGWPEHIEPLSPRDLLADAERFFDLTPLPPQAVPRLYRAAEGNGTVADMPFREILIDEAFDWRDLFVRSVELVDVPGGHSTMLQKPHVEALAADLIHVLSHEQGDRFGPVRPMAHVTNHEAYAE